MDDLASARFDSEWVELEGVVRSAQITEGRIGFILQIPGGRVVGYIPENGGIPLRVGGFSRCNSGRLRRDCE
jgi:hypothetical protein